MTRADASPSASGPRPLGLAVLVLFTGVLGVGAVSAVTVGRDRLAPWLNATTSEVLGLYAAGVGALALLGAALLLALRGLRAFPFDGEVEPASWRAWLVAAGSAGAAIGAYASLMRAPDEVAHLATVFAYVGLLPIAALAITLGRPLDFAAVLLAALLLGVEVAAQLGTIFGPDGTGHYFDDITATDFVCFVIGLAWIGVVAWVRGRRAPT
jgi:hypothetical protein